MSVTAAAAGYRSGDGDSIMDITLRPCPRFYGADENSYQVRASRQTQWRPVRTADTERVSGWRAELAMAISSVSSRFAGGAGGGGLVFDPISSILQGLIGRTTISSTSTILCPKIYLFG